MEVERFEKLLEECRRSLERYVFYRIPNREDAQDLLADIQLKAFEKRDSLLHPQRFKAWILRIASNMLFLIVGLFASARTRSRTYAPGLSRPASFAWILTNSIQAESARRFQILLSAICTNLSGPVGPTKSACRFNILTRLRDRV